MEILIPKNVLLNMHSQLWKVTTGNRDAHFIIHISKEMFLQRCLPPHVKDDVALGLYLHELSSGVDGDAVPHRIASET